MERCGKRPPVAAGTRAARYIEAHRVTIGVPKGVQVWGIDASTSAIGAAALMRPLSFTFTIKGDRKLPWWERSLDMCKSLEAVLAHAIGGRYAETAILALEMPSVYNQRGNVAVKLGDVRGMVMHMFSRVYGSSLIITPNIVPAVLKKRLTGKGNASKELMVACAREWWADGVTGSEHEADALAVAMVQLAEE